MLEKKCEVIFKDRQVEVKMYGIWQRSDVDGAYRAMLKHIPVHILNKKRGDEDARSKRDKAGS